MSNKLSSKKRYCIYETGTECLKKQILSNKEHEKAVRNLKI